VAYKRSNLIFSNPKIIGQLLKNQTVQIIFSGKAHPLDEAGKAIIAGLVAMNGVLNFSTLDGWWPEACQHGLNGWQFGDAFEHDGPKVQDAHDRKARYKVLTEEVIPTFYDRPKQWQKMMKASILSTQEAFSVKRMLDGYYALLYSEAAG